MNLVAATTMSNADQVAGSGQVYDVDASAEDALIKISTLSPDVSYETIKELVLTV